MATSTAAPDNLCEETFTKRRPTSQSLVTAAAAAGALALAAVATGSSGSKEATGLYGHYAATLTKRGLVRAGVDLAGVGGPGLWQLSIGRRELGFTPPHDPVVVAAPSEYPIVALTPRQITLGPEAACSTKLGRTHNSIFKLSQTAAGLRFIAVTIACKEDGGALTVAPWRKK